MTKAEFLQALEARLQGLSPSDIKRSQDFYSEMIDDRMEDGMTEGEAVLAMGAPADAARQILGELSIPKLIKAKGKRARRLPTWAIVLLAVGSPLWIVLGAAALVVILAMYIVIWALVIAVGAVDFALAISGVALIPSSILNAFTSGVPSMLLLLGVGLVAIGLSILLWFVSKPIVKLALFASRSIVRGIKHLIIGKGEINA